LSLSSNGTKLLITNRKPIPDLDIDLNQENAFNNIMDVSDPLNLTLEEKDDIGENHKTVP
jgi:hypothetical protein